MSAGAIHDLGYKRYIGARRGTSTRWHVIMRNQIRSAWKGWWRFKAAVGLATVITAVAGVVLYVFHDDMFRALTRTGIGVTFGDGLIPMSVTWYCKVGFLVSLTIGAGVVATDAQTGAFTFYFARSVRPRDYVIGKVVGLCVLLSVIMLAGPLVLVGLRLGLSADSAELVSNLAVVPKALAVGVLGTLMYAIVPLGFSAALGNRRSALALWAAYYLVFGLMAEGLSHALPPAVGAIDLPSALSAVSYSLFDVTPMNGLAVTIPLSAALVSIAAHVGIALLVLGTKVRSAHLAGIGGSS